MKNENLNRFPYTQLCTISPGQEYRRKLSDFQTPKMVKEAASSADVRKKKILDAVNRPNMKFATDHYDAEV